MYFDCYGVEGRLNIIPPTLDSRTKQISLRSTGSTNHDKRRK